MSFAYPLTGLVTVISVLVFFWMGINVSRVRTKLNVPAPNMTGPDEFMRVLRVHENTMEGLLIFLPLLWLFALTSHDLWAAVVGIIYPIGRLLYARGYYAAADKRGTGFSIGLLSTAVLLLGSVYQMVMLAIASGI
ncbi:MAG: MAPEG family protein [Parvibaculum sp.]|nr:MAPEG family protein [Parvibaculum sp.]